MTRAVSEAVIEVGTAADAELVLVDGVDVAERIRGAEVTRTVSPVSAVPAVRRLLVDRQRALLLGRRGARHGGKRCAWSRGSSLSCGNRP